MIAVWTTVATRADAQRLARACIERRLAACVQLSEIESFYEWDGGLQQEREMRLVLKTTRERYAALEAALRELHPYELPAIVAFDVAQAEPRYRQWVDAQTLPQEP